MRKFLGLLILLSSVNAYAMPVAEFNFGSVSVPIETQSHSSTNSSFSIADSYVLMELQSSDIISLNVPTNIQQLFEERLASHISGVNPLPVKYLPYDYDNGWYDPESIVTTTRRYLYEIIDGVPIFYRIERYHRPNSFNDLQLLPTLDSDKLNVSSSGINPSGNIATLYLH